MLSRNPKTETQDLRREIQTPENSKSNLTSEKENEAQSTYPDQHQPATGEAKALSRTTRAFSRQAPLPLKEGHRVPGL